MAKAQRRLVTPKEYELGVDITQEKYLEVVQKLGDWFAEFRDTKEPVALARRYIDACLKGQKPKTGEPWYEMANSTFAARVRSSCRFDIEKMTPIRTGTEKNRERRHKEAKRAAQKKLAAREDPNIPDELRSELKNTAKYGDNPHVFLSTEEAKQWKQLYDGYLEQFPELRTVAGRSELMTLCDLQIHLERLRFKLLKGDKSEGIDPASMATVARQLADFKKALGIHPEQLAKKNDGEKAMTIGAAVARLQAMPNWRQIRQRYFAEELIQAVQMCLTLRADGAGYQLDEAGFFALTRCRLVHCPQCGIEIVGGFRLREAVEYLLKNDRLVKLPPKEDGTERTIDEIVLEPLVALDATVV
jgi:hypothetical protein